MLLHDIEIEAMKQICREKGISIHQFCTRAIQLLGSEENNATTCVRAAIVMILYRSWSRHKSNKARFAEHAVSLKL